MQVDLEAYLKNYNTKRPHQGRGMNGRTPWRAFLDRIPANDNSQEKTAAKPINLMLPGHPPGRGSCQPITVSVHAGYTKVYASEFGFRRSGPLRRRKIIATVSIQYQVEQSMQRARRR